MKKRNNNGFVLLETLIVTVFISTVLIFLYVQFNTLNNNYEISNKYNQVDDIYLLNTFSNYIKDDWNLYQKLENTKSYLNLSSCEYFTHKEFCKNLIEKEEIEMLLVLPNKFNKSVFADFDDDVIEFINKINPTGNEKYRLIAKFKDGNFATIRFGENNE